MANERKTENIFRGILRNKNIDIQNGYKVEEQKSDNPKINKLLKNASKKGNGHGLPEFIITHQLYPELLIVVECKADIKKHESNTRDQYADYAVDGVLLYASYLAKEYTVISIALSGESENDYKFSSFLTIKGSSINTPIVNKENNSVINELLNFEEYQGILNYSPIKYQTDLDSIINFTKDLHEYIYANVAISEEKKSLLVSAIILGLEHDVFKKSYQDYETQSKGNALKNKICTKLKEAVKESLEDTKMPSDKIDSMDSVFNFIITDKNILQKVNLKIGKSHICHIIDLIKKEVLPFLKRYSDVDVIGHFYNEFIRYTGGDGKGLGIVLTPKHITEFMCDLVEINKDSVVLDTCTGTGGFLISAMSKMIKDVNESNIKTEDKLKKIVHIKTKQLIGVEQQPFIFTMAASNMYFKGDGKTNLMLGSCFEQSHNFLVEDEDKEGNQIFLKPNRALINPPYAQKNENLKEIDFIQFTLDSLEKEGKFACIVPMSTAINNKTGMLGKREKLLNAHRLDAVFSMPESLFEPQASVSTCIMVFTAHVPHSSNIYHETYFGYLKDDGFKLTKKGRVDSGRWSEINKEQLNYFFSKKSVQGKCVSRKVGVKDEWCAEAYIEIDYSTIKEEDFERELRKYLAYKIVNNKLNLGSLNG